MRGVESVKNNASKAKIVDMAKYELLRTRNSFHFFFIVAFFCVWVSWCAHISEESETTTTQFVLPAPLDLQMKSFGWAKSHEIYLTESVFL